MWSDLHTEVLGEFVDAQAPMVLALTRIWWRAHSEYVLRKRAAKKAWSLRALRKRLCKRAVIECGNAKCRAAFVPYRSNTKYCSNVCRMRTSGRKAYYKRRRPLPALARVCPMCKSTFTQRRRDAMYCSARCRHAIAGMAYRRRKAAA